MSSPEPSPAWYTKLLSKLHPELHPIPYYKDRLTVLGIASTFVAAYFILHCIVIFSFSILTTEIELKSADVLEGIIMLLLFLCVWVGGIDDEVVVGNHHLY